jgi:hypothetical protein
MQVGELFINCKSTKEILQHLPAIQMIHTERNMFNQHCSIAEKWACRMMYAIAKRRAWWKLPYEHCHYNINVLSEEKLNIFFDIKENGENINDPWDCNIYKEYIDLYLSLAEQSVSDLKTIA